MDGTLCPDPQSGIEEEPAKRTGEHLRAHCCCIAAALLLLHCCYIFALLCAALLLLHSLLLLFNTHNARKRTQLHGNTWKRTQTHATAWKRACCCLQRSEYHRGACSCSRASVSCVVLHVALLSVCAIDPSSGEWLGLGKPQPAGNEHFSVLRCAAVCWSECVNVVPVQGSCRYGAVFNVM